VGELLTECVTEQDGAVVQFLWPEGAVTREMCGRQTVECSDDCTGERTVGLCVNARFYIE
jgi:hypothetical protein